MDGRVKRTRQNKTVEAGQVEEVKQEALEEQVTPEVEAIEVLQDAEHEYRGHLIICEAGGRVVVAKNGLYCSEFTTKEDAEEYIDAIR